MINYNLGCGEEIIDGYINIDNANLKKIKGKYVRGDITTFNYEFADLFLLDNVIEHFSFEDVSKLLIRLKSFLKPDGKIIIVVPDFKYVTEVICKLSPDTLFSGNVWAKYCLLGTQDKIEDYHRSFYTPQILSYICTNIGFKILSFNTFVYKKHGGYHLKIILGHNNV